MKTTAIIAVAPTWGNCSAQQSQPPIASTSNIAAQGNWAGAVVRADIDPFMNMASTANPNEDYATKITSRQADAMDMACAELREGKGAMLRAPSCRAIGDQKREIEQLGHWLGQPCQEQR